MADRRMFTKKITDSDAFTELPPTTQALYFHLCMNADDDGFNNQIRQAMFNAHADRVDFDQLVKSKFIIPFDERGVIVIKHWRMHNYIQNDRYHETKYLEEKAQLILKKNGAYTMSENAVFTECKQIVSKMDTKRIQDGYKMDTEARLGKDSIDKDSIGKVSIGESEGEDAKASTRTQKKPPKQSWGEYQNVKMTKDEVDKLAAEYGEDMTRKAVKFLDEYIEMKGYKARSHYLCIRKWVITAVKEQEAREHKEYKNPKAEELDHFYQMANDWATKGELNEYEADNGYNTGDSFGNTSSYSGYGDN